MPTLACCRVREALDGQQEVFDRLDLRRLAGAVVNKAETVAEILHGFPQRGRPRLIGGGDEASVFVVTREPPQQHGQVFELADDADDRVRGNPTGDADHQHIHALGGQIAHRPPHVVAGRIVAHRRASPAGRHPSPPAPRGRALHFLLDDFARRIHFAEADKSNGYVFHDLEMFCGSLFIAPTTGQSPSRWRPRASARPPARPSR